MPGFLPVLALLAFVAAERRWSEPESPPALPVLRAAVLWGTAVTALTEGLGHLRALRAGPVAAAWVLLGILGLLAAAAGSAPARGSLLAGPARADRRLVSAVGAIVGSLAAALAVVAAAAPPNTRDSISYHLSRVCHWAVQGSVDNYPTHVLRQLYLTPWAEYAILHLGLLAGGDRAANFVQWGAWAGGLAGAALLARFLGGGAVAQAGAALFAATLPMGALQASGTQNDLVVSFWLAAFAALLFNPAPGPRDHVYAGLSLGLALLTKGTAFLFAAPLVAGIGFRIVARRERRLALVPVLALLVCAPFYVRNTRLCGSPLGVDSGGVVEGRFPLVNDRLDARVLASNALRNVALHAASLPAIGAPAVAIVERIHTVLGVSASDPGTTWTGSSFDPLLGSLHEDHAGNPVHLLVAALGGLAVLARTPRRRAALLLALSVASGALLFCAVLRWQPWNSRLHLPLFVAAAPFAGLLLEETRSRVLRGALALLLVSQALPAVCFSETRPLLGEGSVLRRDRLSQYFVSRPAARDEFLAAAAEIRRRRCGDVGLHVGLDAEEYYLWVALDEPRRSAVRLRHVGVRNGSRRLETPSETPCLVLSDSGDDLPAELAALGLRPVWRRGTLRLLAEPGSAAAGR